MDDVDHHDCEPGKCIFPTWHCRQHDYCVVVLHAVFLVMLMALAARKLSDCRLVLDWNALKYCDLVDGKYSRDSKSISYDIYLANYHCRCHF